MTSLVSHMTCFMVIPHPQCILCTGIDLNKKKSKAKVPNWKLNDIDFVQSNFSREFFFTIKEKEILNMV